MSGSNQTERKYIPQKGDRVRYNGRVESLNGLLGEVRDCTHNGILGAVWVKFDGREWNDCVYANEIIPVQSQEPKVNRDTTVMEILRKAAEESAQEANPEMIFKVPTLIDKVKETVEEYSEQLESRIEQYGAPESSFGTIGESWASKIRAKLERMEPDEVFTLTAAEVAMLLEDFKMCRIFGGINKDDSFGDKTMYSAMSHVLMREEEE